MTKPHFAWYTAYESAVLETDFSKIHERIEVALNAIEKRLDMSKLGDAEFKELQAALRSLAALSAEQATT
jgi:hypothetical protein